MKSGLFSSITNKEDQHAHFFLIKMFNVPSFCTRDGNTKQEINLTWPNSATKR